ncbi:MAG: DUF2147 domain-containing protein [Sphingopyxis sp.]|nr:DUF2147 domain-containing protein [Sphingopyxis sp.]
MAPIRIAFAAAALIASSPVLAAPAAITGQWKTDDGKAVVEIAKCGASLCGKIRRFLVREPVGGLKDSKNADKTKRTRKLLGAPLLWDLKPEANNWAGQGYSPEDGQAFRAAVSIEGDRLKVHGCMKYMCRNAYWTRIR